MVDTVWSVAVGGTSAVGVSCPPQPLAKAISMTANIAAAIAETDRLRTRGTSERNSLRNIASLRG